MPARCGLRFGGFALVLALSGLSACACTSRHGTAVPSPTSDSSADAASSASFAALPPHGSASAFVPVAVAPQKTAPPASSALTPRPGNPTRPGKYDVSIPSPASELVSFLRAHVPKGGSVTADNPPRVRHKVAPGESLASIAKAYLPISERYTASELAVAITQKNGSSVGVSPGTTLEIPDVVTRVVHDDAKDERLGWPDGRVLRGVFVTGPYAGIRWVDTLDKLRERGLNAVVLDQKDYDGFVNYPSSVALVAETKAGEKKHLHVPDLARAVRFAHWRGIRVILRIPCFHDPWADKHAKDSRLSMKNATTGAPMHVEWLDPTNAEAQNYAIELAKEGIEAGADEIQLDYVRFPVHLSAKLVALPAKEERSSVIRDFVRRVHAVTSQAGVALSLDFFGVTATGILSDIQSLGQHIPTVAPEADAISLMSYPSHYDKGWMGFKEPGEHPEIIGIGNVAALKQLAPTGAPTVLRTWLQAFPLRARNYGAAYVAAQAKSAESSGGVGWLMWSPSCEYSAVWNAFPRVVGSKDPDVPAQPRAVSGQSAR